MNTVSENLKRIRQERNLTQQQMADKLYVTQQAVSNWEKGKTMPTVDMLVDIATKLNVEIDQLLYAVDEKKEKQKKKVFVYTVITVTLLFLYIYLFPLADKMREENFDLTLRAFVYFILVPLIYFFIPLTAVQYTKINIRKTPQLPPVTVKTVKIIIIIFMLRFSYHYFCFLSPAFNEFTGHLESSIVSKLLVYIRFIPGRRPWIYSILGAIYGIL